MWHLRQRLVMTNDANPLQYMHFYFRHLCVSIRWPPFWAYQDKSSGLKSLNLCIYIYINVKLVVNFWGRQQNERTSNYMKWIDGINISSSCDSRHGWNMYLSSYFGFSKTWMFFESCFIFFFFWFVSSDKDISNYLFSVLYSNYKLAALILIRKFWN